MRLECEMHFKQIVSLFYSIGVRAGTSFFKLFDFVWKYLPVCGISFSQIKCPRLSKMLSAKWNSNVRIPLIRNSFLYVCGDHSFFWIQKSPEPTLTMEKKERTTIRTFFVITIDNKNCHSLTKCFNTMYIILSHSYSECTNVIRYLLNLLGSNRKPLVPSTVWNFNLRKIIKLIATIKRFWNANCIYCGSSASVFAFNRSIYMKTAQILAILDDRSTIKSVFICNYQFVRRFCWCVRFHFDNSCGK